MTEERAVRWGVLGCARIFRRRMMPAFHEATNAQVVALASRSSDRAAECAGESGIARAYGAYDELLADPDVEAVYIPLPNDLHAEWTLRAVAAGKHVLCDKPIALSFADATRMADAARSAGLRLMEGFMYRHHPQHTRVLEIARSGEIGTPVHFRGVFTYPAEPGGGYRWSPEAGGGALLDVGVYPLNAARLYFDAEPTAVFAVAVQDPDHGVDVRTTATLLFNGDRTATMDCGFDQTYTTRTELAGRDGVVVCERAFQPGDAPVTVTVRCGDDIRLEEVPGRNHYTAEIEHFSRCIADPARPLLPAEDGVAQARLVEAALLSARERRVVQLSEMVA